MNFNDVLFIIVVCLVLLCCNGTHNAQAEDLHYFDHISKVEMVDNMPNLTVVPFTDNMSITKGFITVIPDPMPTPLPIKWVTIGLRSDGVVVWKEM